ncbi:hypothetical protein M758_8G086900 [Ceratodon purpureus]|nr:hypothetical protein M758_8G086900 [Ceratodon purpureus]
MFPISSDKVHQESIAGYPARCKPHLEPSEASRNLMLEVWILEFTGNKSESRITEVRHHEVPSDGHAAADCITRLHYLGRSFQFPRSHPVLVLRFERGVRLSTPLSSLISDTRLSTSCTQQASVVKLVSYTLLCHTCEKLVFTHFVCQTS